ncbi:hypothetical protein B9479_004633 [Cryptococcus floricola]|uniref:Uncharacterized protein n=1 Tax=Cryptococcus floricola TaxID=2591691 RepID=A0A5D3AVT1_9TREE|nr:hypothetical protein B9479_004633 [Cryptococcus floricola]
MNQINYPGAPYGDPYRQAAQHQAQYPQSYNYAAPPNMLPGGLHHGAPPDLAAIARQGYLQQQQKLAQMGQMGVPGMMPNRGGVPGASQPQGYMGITQEMREKHAREMAMREAALRDAVAKDAAKKKARQLKGTPAQQMLPRQGGGFQPPMSSDQYIKNAMTSPAVPQGEPIEPWADSLDELDPRELAMARFRKRHEVIGEIFGPETVKEIAEATKDFDPWSGLDGEALQEKVVSLEQETVDLEEKLAAELEAFKKRLTDIDAGEEL